MEIELKKIVQNLADNALSAADEAKDAVKNTSRFVAQKSAAAKASFDLSVARRKQEDVFADVGRLLYGMRTGALEEGDTAETVQQKIDALLLSAEQMQQQIDHLQEEALKFSPTKVCANCGKSCAVSAEYCPACGHKL